MPGATTTGEVEHMHADDTAGAVDTADGSQRDQPRYRTIAQIVRQVIETRIDAFDGNKSRAARTLGISLKTLYNRLNSYKSADAGTTRR